MDRGGINITSTPVDELSIIYISFNMSLNTTALEKNLTFAREIFKYRVANQNGDFIENATAILYEAMNSTTVKVSLKFSQKYKLASKTTKYKLVLTADTIKYPDTLRQLLGQYSEDFTFKQSKLGQRREEIVVVEIKRQMSDLRSDDPNSNYYALVIAHMGLYPISLLVHATSSPLLHPDLKALMKAELHNYQYQLETLQMIAVTSLYSLPFLDDYFYQIRPLFATMFLPLTPDQSDRENEQLRFSGLTKGDLEVSAGLTSTIYLFLQLIQLILYFSKGYFGGTVQRYISRFLALGLPMLALRFAFLPVSLYLWFKYKLATLALLTIPAILFVIILLNWMRLKNFGQEFEWIVLFSESNSPQKWWSTFEVPIVLSRRFIYAYLLTLDSGSKFLSMQYIITIAISLFVMLALGFLFRKDQSQTIKLLTELYFFTFSFLLMLQSDANDNDNLKFKILTAFTVLIYFIVFTFIVHCLHILIKSCVIRRVRGDGGHRSNVGTRQSEEEKDNDGQSTERGAKLDSQENTTSFQLTPQVSQQQIPQFGGNGEESPKRTSQLRTSKLYQQRYSKVRGGEEMIEMTEIPFTVANNPRNNKKLNSWFEEPTPQGIRHEYANRLENTQNISQFENNQALLNNGENDAIEEEINASPNEPEVEQYEAQDIIVEDIEMQDIDSYMEEFSPEGKNGTRIDENSLFTKS
ncbi:hypothetical protein FGO68_gene11355 [Halteria grandinella]|uniref:Uncharacterized protein n=1 Tax=Halteria grandinella TaxID=5974 RepID=A0A8J8SXA9_HALGN|nr:hypothetical protein FGO68_gene11355 [Halteria grandinella]